MKVLLSIALVLISVATFGEGQSAVEINGTSYTNISKVYVSSTGRIIILYPAGGTSANVDSVPADFLTSWNIGQSSLAGAKTAETATAEKNLDREIREGRFREVEGVVYNTLKTRGSWVTFQNVKVLQVLDEGSIVNTTPNSEENDVVIFVKHLPPVSDTDYITFTAMQDSTYSYLNKLGNDRTIRAYDVGLACVRSEIPAAVLSGKSAYGVMPLDNTPQTDVLASLPDSDNLTASGSGFFVSTDGYLITNNHVVKNARSVKVKNGAGIFPAEVVRTDEVRDLALLKISGQFKPLLISTNDEQLGDSVFTIGFPDITLQGMEPKYTDGKISSLSGIKDDPTEYQISVQVQPGNSGGPLVNANGNVAGVIVARLNDFAALKSMGSLPQNVNYAIKGQILRDFLSQSPEIKLTSVPDSTGSSVVASVQKSVAIVLVY